MTMLAAVLQEQEKQEAWQAYTAQMLWYLNHATFKHLGKNFDHPTWLSMVSPKEKDERSGIEIVDDLKAQLIKRKQKRERRE